MKELRELTEKEYTDLSTIGMLYVCYPGATGSHYRDCPGHYPSLHSDLDIAPANDSTNNTC